MRPVSVVVPWRGTCGHRAAALGYVRARWAQLGRPVELQLGELPDDDSPWCKALAVQNGVDRTSGDVLVIADGDVWCDGLADAIDAVVDGAAWAVPHLLVHRLTEEATAQVLDGVPPHAGMPLAVLDEPYTGRLGGGVVVLPRSTWDDCPLDVRFRGWGHEDEAWAKALGHLYGPPVRGSSTLWHLWHPPQERITWGLGSIESQELYDRYHHAARNPDRSAMRALLAEGAPTQAR